MGGSGSGGRSICTGVRQGVTFCIGGDEVGRVDLELHLDGSDRWLLAVKISVKTRKTVDWNHDASPQAQSLKCQIKRGKLVENPASFHKISWFPLQGHMQSWKLGLPTNVSQHAHICYHASFLVTSWVGFFNQHVKTAVSSSSQGQKHALLFAQFPSCLQHSVLPHPLAKTTFGIRHDLFCIGFSKTKRSKSFLLRHGIFVNHFGKEAKSPHFDIL